MNAPRSNCQVALEIVLSVQKVSFYKHEKCCYRSIISNNTGIRNKVGKIYQRFSKENEVVVKKGEYMH